MERLQLHGKVPMCRHCGMPGAHYVGPSFGESGFYICEPKSTDHLERSITEHVERDVSTQ
jgi:hypothetical protein